LGSVEYESMEKGYKQVIEYRSIDPGNEILHVFADSLEPRQGKRGGQYVTAEAEADVGFLGQGEIEAIEVPVSSTSSLVNVERQVTIASGEM
jgi:hypothetical protein